MDITVTQLTDIELARKACSFTSSKESKITLERLAQCEHSPLRCIMFSVEMRDIPTFVSVHLVRHKIGVEHFVKSNREDLPGYTGDTGRNHPVNHMMLINAQALIQLARKRLCTKAHAETQEVVRDIVSKLPPELAKFCVPECEYRGGICYELKPCGRGIPVRSRSKRAIQTVEDPR